MRDSWQQQGGCECETELRRRHRVCAADGEFGEKQRKAASTHQVVHAQQEGFDAAVALAIPAGGDAQVDPHQLGEELQGEAAQPVLGAPVQLEQLVAHGFQQLE